MDFFALIQIKGYSKNLVFDVDSNFQSINFDVSETFTPLQLQGSQTFSVEFRSQIPIESVEPCVMDEATKQKVNFDLFTSPSMVPSSSVTTYSATPISPSIGE